MKASSSIIYIKFTQSQLYERGSFKKTLFEKGRDYNRRQEGKHTNNIFTTQNKKTPSRV